MDFFLLKQDRRFINPPLIQNLSGLLRRKELCLKDEHKIQERNVVFANNNKPLDFLDLLDEQMFLVTEKIQKVIEIYEPTAIFKTFCVLNNRKNEYCLYYAPILPEVGCITETKGIGCKRALFLDREKVGNHCFFRALGADNETTIVRIDAAESLLRRKVRGITLEKI